MCAAVNMVANLDKPLLQYLNFAAGFSLWERHQPDGWNARAPTHHQASAHRVHTGTPSHSSSGQFDAPQQHFIPPPPGSLQQPAVVPYRQFIPMGLVTPPPLPPVDWAVISYALITAAEQQPALMILTNYDF